MADNQTENQEGQRTLSSSDESTRLRAAEDSIRELSGSVFGNVNQGHEGLVKRVTEIETGDLRKVKARQNLTIVISSISVICIVVATVYKVMG